jgi:hypothetical protein
MNALAFECVSVVAAVADSDAGCPLRTFGALQAGTGNENAPQGKVE